MKHFHKILTILLLAILTLPGIQHYFKIFEFEPLHGVYVKKNLPEITLNDYLTFDLQKDLGAYIDQNFGFREVFIRSFNQAMFSIFNFHYGNGVVVGKDQYLYERWFIKEKMGQYLSAPEKINDDIKKLEIISNYLKHFDTELLLVIAPGKPYYYPEYIPDGYRQTSNRSNTEQYTLALSETNINYFEINSWFVELKDKTDKPLFSKTGTHWSLYGGALAADSLVRLSEKVMNRKLNEITIEGVEWDTIPRDTDKDLEELMNLWFPIKSIPLAYPKIKKHLYEPYDDRPEIVVIGDSFFWTMIDAVDSTFKTNFWYYFNSVYYHWGNGNHTVKDFEYEKHLRNAEMVILMNNTAGIANIGYGFLNDFYSIIRENENQKRKRLIEFFEKDLRNNPGMTASIEQKARERGISIDSMYYLDAVYLANLKIQNDTLSHLSN